jgi:uncharacterized small protein (DUF1192 family)
VDELAAREDDPLWEELSRLSVEQLKARWRRLHEDAKRLVNELAARSRTAPEPDMP